MSQTKAQLLGPVLGTVEYAGDVNFDSGTLFVDSANNRIGIGTDNPTEALHLVTGSGDSITTFKVKTGGGVDLERNHARSPYIKTLMSSGRPTIIMGNTDTGDTVKLNIAGNSFFNGGNVGIGTDTPDRLLHLSSNTNTRAKIATTSASSFGQLYLGDEEKWIVGYRESHPNEPHAIALKATNSSGYINLFTGGDNERLRITSAGTLESYSPDDTTPNFKFRSDDTNWFGALNQSVHGATITTFLSCGGDWSANGTTYSATKALAAYPTSAIAIHNQYNNTWGSQFVFLTKAGGSTTTDGTVTERLRITSTGNVGIGTDNPGQKLTVQGEVQINKTGKSLYLNAYPGVQDNTVSFEAIRADFTTGASILEISTKNDASSLIRRMRIDHEGNVGIGSNVTTPNHNLHVANDSSSVTSVAIINSGSGQSRLWLQAGGTTNRASRIDFVNSQASTSVPRWTLLNDYDQNGVNSFDFVNATNSRVISINQSGNVGIGTTNPSTKLHLYGTTHQLRLQRTNTGPGYLDIGLSHTVASNYGSVYFTAETSGNTSDFIFRHGVSSSYSEKLRIASSGNVGIGTDNPANLLHLNQTVGSGTTYILFSHNGNSTGSIYQDGAGTGYSTTSDYRLKENILPLGDGLTRIKQLKPCTFNWKNSDNLVEGFIAHEVQSVVPSAVIGEKDQLNTDGTINPQQLDNFKLIPLLVKCIQELTDKIELLESKLLGD